MRQIVLDTETTGLSPEKGHRIIEIGCVEMMHRRLTGEVYHVYINPDREVEEGAIAVHGITNEFLEDKPFFADVVHDFIEFIKGAELIIHNAPFDIGFMQHEFKLAKQKGWHDVSKHCQITDTLALARQKHPGQRNNLDALCKRYQINNAHREKHGALLDAEILAEVYLAMTGGQSKLNLDNAQKSKTNEDNLPLQPHQTEQFSQLTIIEPSPEELNAHREIIQKIAKVYKDDPIWLN